MKKIIMLVVALGLMLGAVSVGAKVVPNLDKGTHQIGVAGFYDNNTIQDYQLTLAGSYMYSVWDNIQLGSTFGYSSNDYATSGVISAVAVYNIQTDTAWVPFLQLGLGWVGVDYDRDWGEFDGTDDNAWVGDIGGGVKYFLTNDVALALSVTYQKSSEKLYMDEDGNFEDDNVSTLLGLQFYFN